MKYYTYILRSYSTGKFYCGITNDTKKRLKEHNDGKCRSTKSGIPWEKVYAVEFVSREQAHELELKIKGCGPKRYFEESGLGPDLSSG